jgi:hypothetical protein
MLRPRNSMDLLSSASLSESVTSTRGSISTAEESTVRRCLSIPDGVVFTMLQHPVDPDRRDYEGKTPAFSRPDGTLVWVKKTRRVLRLLNVVHGPPKALSLKALDRSTYALMATGFICPAGRRLMNQLIAPVFSGKATPQDRFEFSFDRKLQVWQDPEPAATFVILGDLPRVCHSFRLCQYLAHASSKPSRKSLIPCAIKRPLCVAKNAFQPAVNASRISAWKASRLIFSFPGSLIALSAVAAIYFRLPNAGNVDQSA